MVADKCGGTLSQAPSNSSGEARPGRTKSRKNLRFYLSVGAAIALAVVLGIASAEARHGGGGGFRGGGGGSSFSGGGFRGGGGSAFKGGYHGSGFKGGGSSAFKGAYHGGGNKGFSGGRAGKGNAGSMKFARPGSGKHFYKPGGGYGSVHKPGFGKGYAYKHKHHDKKHHRKHIYYRYARHYYYYDFYDYSYADNCAWLYRKAIYTGSAYWWNRYYACVNYY